MRVNSLTLQNFKSFRDVTIPFRPFNVVIGGNASGKSNLVQAFQFLKDIADHGLENAVSLQGGAEFLRNMDAGVDESVIVSVEFELISENQFIFDFPSDENEVFSIRLSSEDRIRAKHIIKHTLEMKVNSSHYRLDAIQEEWFHRLEILDTSDIHNPEPINQGCATLSNMDGKLALTTDNEPLFKGIYPSFIEDMALHPGGSLLEMHLLRVLLMGGESGSLLDGISIYDMDPRIPKRGSPITGKADLESDGSNLAIVLNDILRDKERSRRFHNLIHDLLPFVEKASVDRFADNSLMIKLRESYAPDRDIPAPFLSDGTIEMTAALVALRLRGTI